MASSPVGPLTRQYYSDYEKVLETEGSRNQESTAHACTRKCIRAKVRKFHPSSQVWNQFHKFDKISKSAQGFPHPSVSGTHYWRRHNKHLPWFEKQELKSGIKNLFFPCLEYEKRKMYILSHLIRIYYC